MKEERIIKIALAGQPNCGKSTIFNAVAGYKAIVSNFPGTTVEYTKTKIKFGGRTIELIDLPGTYSLSTMDAAELSAVKFLLEGDFDVVINVMDASVMSRSLELTLELIEYDIPMVICLNMIDEAEKKGIVIDEKKLEEKFGIPVVKAIAIKGKGIRELFHTAIEVAETKRKPLPFKYDEGIEREIERCMEKFSIKDKKGRLFAIKILEGDSFFKSMIRGAEEIEEGKWAEAIVKERHALAMKTFEEVARIFKGKRSTLENRIDAFLLTGWRGYLFSISFFFLVLFLIFSLGGWIEEIALSPLDKILDVLSKYQGPSYRLVEGLVQGIAGGIAVVLPYLLPLLFVLSLTEDIGILPRIAFAFDSIMHRIGLHGKSVIPFVIGYGCTVPALMSTKILETESERKKVALLTGLIPCSARTTVILAMIGFYAGFYAVVIYYLFNLFIVAISGRIIAQFTALAPGLIIEIPPYRIPYLNMVFKKVWFRAKDFIFRAWPVLITGSIFFSLLKVFNLEDGINSFLKPFTEGLLGLPPVVGITLIFGILRKELSMIMLMAALGTTDVSSSMSIGEIIRFTIFITFYIPCLATIIYTWRNFGGRFTILAAFFNTFIATLLTFLSKFLF
jgi:ferrous iron transport protein B